MQKFFDRGGSNNDFASRAVLDGYGGLLVAGTADDSGFNHLEVCRFSTALIADTSFGTSGCFEYSLGSGQYFSVAGIARAGNGGFIVAGTLNASGDRGFFALRVTSAGAVDGNFGVFGIRVVQLTSGADIVESMDVDLDGEILLAGRVPNGSSTYAALVKLTAAGNLDTGFGPNQDGTEIVNAAGFRSTALNLRAGTTFALGVYYGDGTARAGEVESDGSLDPFPDVTWNGSYTNYPTRLFVQSVQGHQTPLIAGDYAGSGSNGAVLCATRLLAWNFPQGEFDITWGINGKSCFSPYDAGYGNGFSTGAAALSGGRMVLGASANGSGNEDWLILRLTSRLIFADDFETADVRMWSAHAGFSG